MIMLHRYMAGIALSWEVEMAKDIRDLKASSSILSVLRYGGVIEFWPFKIKAAQAHKVIVVFKKDTRDSEYPFSIAGLTDALDRVK